VSEPGAVERLRNVPLMGAMDDSALKLCAELATEFEVPAGHVLAEHGQPGSGMFLITEGTVMVQLPTGPVELGPGEFFGELALLADVGRIARVRASTPVRGLAIGRKEFSELLQREPRVAVAMLPVLAQRLAEAESP
jgi:voltage-gated potassium channel